MQRVKRVLSYPAACSVSCLARCGRVGCGSSARAMKWRVSRRIVVGEGCGLALGRKVRDREVHAKGPDFSSAGLCG